MTERQIETEGEDKEKKVTFPTILSKIMNNLLIKYISIKLSRIYTPPGPGS